MDSNLFERNDKNDLNSFVMVSFGDLIDFISTENYKRNVKGIEVSSYHIIKVLIENSCDKEKVLSLIFFLCNYQQNDMEDRLRDLVLPSEIMNARLCDIPILTFAKLKRPEIVNTLIEKGAYDISTSACKNKGLIHEVMKLLTLSSEEKRNIHQRK